MQTYRALNEIIDLVPVNKIIAFGGDYRVCVQKVYGHLVLTREVVATVMARRLDRGLVDLEQALWLARRLFYENAAELYLQAPPNRSRQ